MNAGINVCFSEKVVIHDENTVLKTKEGEYNE